MTHSMLIYFLIVSQDVKHSIERESGFQILSANVSITCFLRLFIV